LAQFRFTWGFLFSASLLCELLVLSTPWLAHNVRFVWMRGARVLLVLCKAERYQPTMVWWVMVVGGVMVDGKPHDG
jgi:hypothetical protein